jgi:hypothetical protein
VPGLSPLLLPPPPQQATASRAVAIRQRRAQAKSMLIPWGDALDLGLGAVPMSLVAAHQDRAQRGGPRFFVLPSWASLFSHL